ncbi:thioredoxin family protein [candidate division BRC1 bacterium HGW-BRC1-1]|jgi:small redox-active disulfide protein 2|nr:MAG: thioredoxin family protein [candidate division BRC1 bacterium HGW-BRC1-1]
MKKIQVLGTGCPKCAQLTANAEEAVKSAGVDYEVEKVTDITKIVEFGVMTTPALVVDGRVTVAGRVASVDEIKKFLGE